MIAGALWLLDRLPVRARRPALVALVAFAVAAVIALLLVAPRPAASPGWHSQAHSGAPSRAATRPSSRPRQQPRPQPPLARPPSVSAVRKVALAFLAGYLAYAYGRGTLSAIPDASQSLTRALTSADASAPPAARRRRATVASLRVTVGAHGTASAIAAVSDSTGVAYPLTLQLQQRADRWQITSLGDD